MGKAFQLTKEISSPGDNLGLLLEKKLVAIFRGYFHSYKLPLFLLVQFAKGFSVACSFFLPLKSVTSKAATIAFFIDSLSPQGGVCKVGSFIFFS